MAMAIACQARPVFGEPAACDVIAGLIRRLLIERPWHDADGTEIRRLRSQLAHHASPNNLKRAAGGTLDVEFIVQMLQLHHAGAKPGILLTNTQSALVALAAAGLLGRNTAAELGESYRFCAGSKRACDCSTCQSGIICLMIATSWTVSRS